MLDKELFWREIIFYRGREEKEVFNMVIEWIRKSGRRSWCGRVGNY